MLRLFQGFGIELEYMLVAADSLDVAPRADWLLAEAAGDITGEYCHGDMAWNNELALHVIEFKLNGPAPGLGGLAARFHGEIARANALLAGRGLALMPSAMHPWMDPSRELRLWPHDNREVYDCFDRIFSCKGHGWANLQSMHINLPFADDREFAALHAAVRFLLPLMPGLAASSPVMDARLTGIADNRLDVYRGNCRRIPSVTGEVVPEPVYGIAEYQRRILGRIYADLAPLDPQGLLAEEWVNARGAIPRFGRMALEIRVLDVQECPRMDLAFAQLIVAVLRSLCEERHCDLRSLQDRDTAGLARYLAATIVDAEATEIHDSGYLAALGYRGSSIRVGQLWGVLAERAAQAGALDRDAERALEHYLRHGTLATRIVAALPREPGRSDLERVYRQLCQCLAMDEPYAAPSRR
ncbi:MAG: glutamate--cysteine ligase [Gammaproteobacteria bacterium]|nr:glutamate--cysteine ligase [Gammaproteobacteria bacterium]QOJ30725.1 MAG: glutamate--cysteine ligase [Gammaproteobacteria bacterium]